LFLAEAEGRSSKYKNSTHPEGYGRNKLPPRLTHRRGGGNRRQNTPGLKPAPSARVLKITTKYRTNSQPKESICQKPKQNPIVRKTKKPKSVVEAPGKAHPPQRSLTIPEYAYHGTQPPKKVNVSEPYDLGCGASGRTCGGLGRGSPQVLRGSEVNGGRTPERPSQVGGVGCYPATGRRPSEGGEGCAQSSRTTREGGPKRDHNFSTMPTVLNSDPRR